MFHDMRHYGPAIVNRLIEATLLALDIPHHPTRHLDVIMSVGVRYDPSGPRDIQRFVPDYCEMLSVARMRSTSPRWAAVFDRRDREDARARASGCFGASLIQLVYFAPEVHGRNGEEPAIVCTFERIRLRQVHATSTLR